MTYKIMIAIYIRVSTQEQAAEGYSISEQTERLTKYAEAHDWTIYKTYTDPGYSGGSLDRPAIQDLIKDAAAGRINKVLVYKLDRLSRSQKDTLYLIEDVFIKNNVDFVSMTENFDTGTPFGRAMIGILSVFAQLEREQIKERMQLGADARAKKGYFHGGGFDPIGYDYIDGELIINEYEAMQIKKIYDMVEQGLAINKIKNTLNKQGFNHKYGKWTDTSVRSVLQSVIYTGKIQWKNNIYPGRHEAIIEPERFDRIKSVLIHNKSLLTKNVTPFKRTTLLGGLIYCGHCGARYYAKQNTTSKNGFTQKYYTCYSRGRSSGKMVRDLNCKNKTWNIKDLDKIIIDQIKKLALDPERFKSNTDRTSDIYADQKNLIEQRIKEIEKKIDKLIELYTNGVTYEKINDKIQDLYDEKTSLEISLENLIVSSAPALSISEANEILNSFADIIDSADTDELKTIVHSLIDKILIDGGDIKIFWKFA